MKFKPEFEKIKPNIRRIKQIGGTVLVTGLLYFLYADVYVPLTTPPVPTCTAAIVDPPTKALPNKAPQCQITAEALIKLAQADKKATDGQQADKRIAIATVTLAPTHKIAEENVRSGLQTIAHHYSASPGTMGLLRVEFADGHKADLKANIGELNELYDLLGARYHEVESEEPGWFDSIVQFLSDNFFYILLSLGFLATPLFAPIIMRKMKEEMLAAQKQMQGGMREMGKSKHKVFEPDKNAPKITFNDVAGVEEASEDLKEIVDFLADPAPFEKLGARIPSGVLLIGPPGTGKTLLARAIAGEANVPFFEISGSDFVEMFVGVGASRVRDMFEQAQKEKKCIIFIDELDAVGRHRGKGLGNNNDERESTLNQMLVAMDGFNKTNTSIVMIAATNRPEVLDPALLRPGRFDRQVVVSLADLEGRIRQLRVHVRNKPLAPDVSLFDIARGTPGFSGADLMNLANEAAILAARRGRTNISMKEFEDAKDKIMMGAAKPNLMSDQEKILVSYHEAAHVLQMLEEEKHGGDPFYKVTIIPRGRGLGGAMPLPVRERQLQACGFLDGMLRILYAGRTAEEMVFGSEHVTGGAASDISRATMILHKSLTEAGFGSEELGWIRYADTSSEDQASGAFPSQQRTYSEQTAQKIDQEKVRLQAIARKQVLNYLTSKRADLDLLAFTLFEKETLTENEVRKLLGLPALVLRQEGDKPQKRTAKEILALMLNKEPALPVIANWPVIANRQDEKSAK